MTRMLKRTHDERGQSVSLFALVIMAAMIMTAGLVIDGGQKITAASRAEAAAAGAARAAGNAAATQELAGVDPVAVAVTAANRYLDGQPGVAGSVSVSAGVVTVTTESSAATFFLSVIGIGSLSATGSATANIVATGESR